jgi:hypothetical protein
VIPANLQNEPRWRYFSECFSRLFAILFKLAVNSSNILKGPAAEKSMIAAFIQLPGILLEGSLTGLEIAGRCVIFESLISADLLSRHGVHNA